MKTYSSQAGYVYQYVYEGHRPSKAPDGVEYVFSFSADRKTWHHVRVIVETAGVASWGRSHGRTLTSTEWFALAKISLFTAFDERSTPEELRASPVHVRQADIDAIMQQLDSESP